MGVPFVPSAPGTISVTNGIKNIVGTSTTFTQYQAYDTLWILGVPYLIATITDDTHLALKVNYAGSTASGVAYDWTPMPDVSRAQSAAQAIKAMVSNGVLAAIAGVGSAADKIAYYTGSGTAALTSLTSWARGLLGAASAVAGYDIVKSHAATSVVAAATISLDAANGDLVDITGNTGISAITLADGRERLLHFTGTPLITAGANLVLNNGGANYQVAAGDMAIARGGAASLVYLLIIPGDGRDPKTPTGAAGSFERFTGAATSAMQAIVGAVSQSGGVPTGAIIEAGSNSNGSYIRFADGTQICRGQIASRSVAITTVAGSLFFSSTQTGTFAATFASLDFVSSNESVGIPGQTTSTLSTISWLVFAGSSGTFTSHASFLAVGRWY